MKNFKKNILFLAVMMTALVFNSCQEEDQEFGDLVAPSNISLTFDILGQDTANPNGDGSGIVDFTATADDAITFIYSFGDGSDNVSAPNGTATHRFTQLGLNSYNVTVIASGTGGVSTTFVMTIDVFSAFDDLEAKSFLTGAPITLDGNGDEVIDVTAAVSKTWVLDDSKTGHLGVGPSAAFDIQIFGAPNQYYYPAFFAAGSGTFCGTANDCFCDDELIFTMNPDGTLSFLLDNKGETFFNGNAAHQAIVGGAGGGDACFTFDTSGVSNVALAPTSEDWGPAMTLDAGFDPRGTVMNFSNGGFMSYYIGTSSYEILSISETELHVRANDGADANLAWYLRFTSL
jgi:hypothetical protein